MQHEERVRRRLQLAASGPFASWLDAAVIRAQADEVEVQLPYRDELGGEAGGALIHRGVVAAFAELAGALVDTQALVAVTHRSLILDYLNDAPAGSALYARARLVNGAVRIEIRASDTRILVARATLLVRGAASVAAPADPQAQPIYPN
jgi:uncharacterized protein (TIGR00369 family)